MGLDSDQSSRGALYSLVAFYALVAFEFFYMASPFAAYFYAVYKPGIVLFSHVPAISWMAGFFLPHLAEDTQNVLLNSLKPAGALIAAGGLLTFLVCAAQVYYSKLFRKGIVSGGLYSIIRHPQYTAFAICSFGLLLLWPRYLTLVLFVAMLFAYYLLAKIEERECERKFGQSYRDYAERTPMFLPIKLGFLNRMAGLSFCRQYPWLLITAAFLLGMTGSVLLARQIKSYAVTALYTSASDNTVNLAVYRQYPSEIEQIVAIAKNDPQVAAHLHKCELPSDKMINYVLPAGVYISEIPMNKPTDEECHIFLESDSIDRKRFTVIFTRAQIPAGQETAGLGILTHATTLTPRLEVWVDAESKTVLRILKPPALQRYENIPEPVF